MVRRQFVIDATIAAYGAAPAAAAAQETGLHSC